MATKAQLLKENLRLHRKLKRLEGDYTKRVKEIADIALHDMTKVKDEHKALVFSLEENQSFLESELRCEISRLNEKVFYLEGNVKKSSGRYAAALDLHKATIEILAN